MLLYCLFLRSAPHQSEANIFHCTKIARPPIVSGATRLHWVGRCRYRLNKAMTVPEWQMMGRKAGDGRRRRRNLSATLAQAHQQRGETKQRRQRP
ncbi:hypothetical protein EAN86_25560 [Klebsiella pneumoniae]|nr:hypothetical protein EAN86_25560 [Klebsiella pneumoniae]